MTIKIRFLLTVVFLFAILFVSQSGKAAAIDITGTYVSDMTSDHHSIFGSKQERSIELTLFQRGNKITGTDKSKKGELEGVLDGDTIDFVYWPAYPGFWGGKIIGKWKLNADGRIMNGSWYSDQYSARGKWNIKRTDTKDFSQRPGIKKKADSDEIIQAASGTGFAVSANGHIVTNNHVIDGCTHVNIHHRGKAIRSTIIYRDPINDLALLQGDFIPTTIFKISRRNPEIMQEIFVAGYPFGNRVSSSVKVTKGIVSSLSGIGNNVSNIQIDAALQPGNSGGPIFDNKGNVVGVAVAKLDFKKVVEDWGVIPENTNFGIKSNVVANMLEGNGIKIHEESNSSISNAELGNLMSGATYHLSCWMTMTQVRKMTTSKVLFPDLTE